MFIYGSFFTVICFQDAIEMYKSLPAELESMKAVLDMKKEENKQLRKELMESKLEVKLYLGYLLLLLV
jgi:hypothetical protein